MAYPFTPNYNGYYPNGYTPYNYNYPQYPQNPPMGQQPMMQQTHTPAQPVQTQNMPNATQTNQVIQNGGFVSVRSEMEARNYPVAPGNSITFKDENTPYVYTKTMGFSQLDRPSFEKYRLVRESENSSEESHNQEPEKVVAKEYAEKSDFEKLVMVTNAIKKEVDSFRTELDGARADLDYVMTKRNTGKVKKEKEENE